VFWDPTLPNQPSEMRRKIFALKQLGTMNDDFARGGWKCYVRFFPN